MANINKSLKESGAKEIIMLMLAILALSAGFVVLYGIYFDQNMFSSPFCINMINFFENTNAGNVIAIIFFVGVTVLCIMDYNGRLNINKEMASLAITTRYYSATGAMAAIIGVIIFIWRLLSRF